MTRFQNFEEIYSALYVDFDNIYTRLAEQEQALARTFATNPQRWMRWLEGHALRMMYGDGVRRRILKRCCYLNPIRYHEFRPFFIRTAFQVVDCPPLTNYGKTSADIHLVMDCMDALAHVTRFDEIIILSGDADFTPLLLRIQEHARRSLVLSVGYTSPAYAAACSWRIREDWFIAQALEEPHLEENEPREERIPDLRHSDHRESRAPDERSRATAASEREPHEQGNRQDKGSGISLPGYKRARLIESIKRLVEESSVPVPLPSVAQVLRREQDASPDWFNAGTLRDLLESLDLTPIEFSPIGQGFVYDPNRHDRPEESGLRDDFRLHMPALYDFALKVHRLTDVPLLKPEHYSILLNMLTDEVKHHGFSRSEIVRHIEDRCEDEELPVSASQISFVVEAVIRGGINLSAGGKTDTHIDLKKVRRAFLQRVIELCKLFQLSLNPAEMALLQEWLQSDKRVEAQQLAP
ncbi:MAG: NYN domain-containing protein [Desulfovibrio sp.]|jgi:hypothetical protein|nr:NYN domain-containing protein [Desulfovibrio sp.]